MKCGFLFFVLLGFLASPVSGGESPWVLISREGECMALERLARRENLPKTPATPEEFATMMRDRGYHVTLGLPEGFPPEFSGRAVQVRVRDSMAPIFVREEICHQVDK